MLQELKESKVNVDLLVTLEQKETLEPLELMAWMVSQAHQVLKVTLVFSATPAVLVPPALKVILVIVASLVFPEMQAPQVLRVIKDMLEPQVRLVNLAHLVNPVLMV